MIEAVIFDGEGVVIDTEDLWDEGQRAFFQRRGAPYDRERVKHLIAGVSLAEGTRILKAKFALSGQTEDLALERAEDMRKLFRGRLRFIDGFPAFFQRLPGEYKTCMATATSEDLLKIAVKELRLQDLFGNRIFSFNDVSSNGSATTKNELFLHAANEMGCHPANCLVIEDSPNGVRAAKSVGMQCVALTTTFDKQRLGAADQVTDSFADIRLHRYETHRERG